MRNQKIDIDWVIKANRAFAKANTEPLMDTSDILALESAGILGLNVRQIYMISGDFYNAVISKLRKLITPHLKDIKLDVNIQGVIAQVNYDPQGRIVYRWEDKYSDTDKIVITKFNYLPSGEIHSEITYTDDILSHHISYEYADGKMVARTVNDIQMERTTYNKDGYPIRVDYPEGWVEYDVDDDGNCIGETLSDGTWINRTYDEHGHILVVADSKGSSGTYTYDEYEPGYFRVSSYVNPLGSTEFTYDVNCNLTQANSTADGMSVWAYDEEGRLVALRNSEYISQMTYDDAGMLATITSENILKRDAVKETRIITLDHVEGGISISVDEEVICAVPLVEVPEPTDYVLTR